MPYNSLITRADIAALNTEQVSTAMLDSLPASSAAMQLFRRIPVAKSQVRFPVLSALPTAYWVSGDTGLKQTTESAWTNVYMYVEELAAIVPIPDAVIEDAEFDVQAAIRPLVADAIGQKLDAAVFFGTDKPSTWPDDIATDAIAAGNHVFRGTTAANAGGIAEDINLLMGTVEADGYDVNGFVANRTFRARIRGARATDGQKLLDVTTETVEGVPLVYGAMGGLWPATGDSDVELFAGDWTKGLLGIRRDITFDVSNEAVIQDGNGAIVYNAYQQDLTLLRVTFRVGWTVANPVNRYQATEGSRYPFGVLRSPNT
jgi:HK97 family phage major capsid protein